MIQRIQQVPQMLIYLLIATCLFISGPVVAEQWYPGYVESEEEEEYSAGRFGLRLGLSIANIVNRDFWWEENFRERPRITLAFGGFYWFSLSDSMTFRPEITYVKKGAQYTGGDPEYVMRSGEASIVMAFDYIEIPCLFAYHFETSSPLEPYLLFGPIIGILLSAESILEGFSFDEYEVLSPVEFELAVGVGINISSVPSDIVLEGRYSRGISPIQRWNRVDHGLGSNNSVFLISLGYLI